MTEAAVTTALLDLRRAAMMIGAAWSLVGGHALRSYGVPRETLDADALVDEDRLLELAETLIKVFGWKPLKWDEKRRDFVLAKKVKVLTMDDPVLYDMRVERRMIPLASSVETEDFPYGLPVDILAAQHPVEKDMVLLAGIRTYAQVPVPIAPLGGVLLVKTKANRKKDLAAIEQSAETLSREVMGKAESWAKKRDPATAEELHSMVQEAQLRRRPTGHEKNRRRR